MVMYDNEYKTKEIKGKIELQHAQDGISKSCNYSIYESVWPAGVNAFLSILVYGSSSNFFDSLKVIDPGIGTDFAIALIGVKRSVIQPIK